jgi:hypothetical protein
MTDSFSRRNSRRGSKVVSEQNSKKQSQRNLIKNNINSVDSNKSPQHKQSSKSLQKKSKKSPQTKIKIDQNNEDMLYSPSDKSNTGIVTNPSLFAQIPSSSKNKPNSIENNLDYQNNQTQPDINSNQNNNNTNQIKNSNEEILKFNFENADVDQNDINGKHKTDPSQRKQMITSTTTTRKIIEISESKKSLKNKKKMSIKNLNEINNSVPFNNLPSQKLNHIQPSSIVSIHEHINQNNNPNDESEDETLPVIPSSSELKPNKANLKLNNKSTPSKMNQNKGPLPDSVMNSKFLSKAASPDPSNPSNHSCSSY